MLGMRRDQAERAARLPVHDRSPQVNRVAPKLTVDQGARVVQPEIVEPRERTGLTQERGPAGDLPAAGETPRPRRTSVLPSIVIMGGLEW